MESEGEEGSQVQSSARGESASRGRLHVTRSRSFLLPAGLRFSQPSSHSHLTPCSASSLTGPTSFLWFEKYCRTVRSRASRTRLSVLVLFPSLPSSPRPHRRPSFLLSRPPSRPPSVLLPVLPSLLLPLLVFLCPHSLQETSWWTLTGSTLTDSRWSR